MRRPTVRAVLASIACALLVACGPQGSPAPAAANGWALDHEEPAGVLLSVWGTGPRDVWAAGGQAGAGIALHFDGASWQPVDTTFPALLWWVYGFAPDDVYAVGERGIIVHYDGRNWTRVESGTDRTLYGLWGSSGADVWIVGGDAGGAPGSGVVLRGGRAGFRPVELPPALVPDAFFKVYGITSDVVVVGRAGTILRYDGSHWRGDEVPTRRPILSLWARGPDDLYAVGGQDVGEILRFDGLRWSPADGLGTLPGLSGVFTAPGHPVIAVGSDATIVEVDAQGASSRTRAPGVDPRHVLHSVWGDGEGTAYAVGGSLLEYPGAMSGVVVRKRGLPPPTP
jgi:hypothetical protein